MTSSAGQYGKGCGVYLSPLQPTVVLMHNFSSVDSVFRGLMTVDLTTLQRRLLTAGAAAVAALLWIEFQRVGIDDTPWIIGVLIITGFLFVAFSPSTSDQRGARAAQRINPNKAMVAAFASVETDFMRVWEVTSEKMETNATLVMLEENMRLQAAKLAWIAVLFALEREKPGFRQSAQFEEMTLLGGVEFRKHLRHFIKNTTGTNAGTKARELAAIAAAECTCAFDKAYALNAKKQPQPMTPIFAMIEKTFPFSNALKQGGMGDSARLETSYGPVLRKAIVAASEAR